MKPLQRQLRSLIQVVLDECEHNPNFAVKLSAALGHGADPGSGLGGLPGAKPHRRQKGVIDPYLIYESGEGVLRAELARLDLERLKDIVAEHGMDSSKLAMKWKTPSRLVELIVDVVKARVRKGDAFRPGTPIS